MLTTSSTSASSTDDCSPNSTTMRRKVAATNRGGCRSEIMMKVAILMVICGCWLPMTWALPAGASSSTRDKYDFAVFFPSTEMSTTSRPLLSPRSYFPSSWQRKGPSNVVSSRSWDPSTVVWDPDSTIVFDTPSSSNQYYQQSYQQQQSKYSPTYAQSDPDIVHFRPSHLKDDYTSQVWEKNRNPKTKTQYSVLHADTNVGSWCKLEDGLSSRCLVLSECPTALDDLVLYNIRPVRCGFKGNEEVVCCPDNAYPAAPKPWGGNGNRRRPPWNWGPEEYPTSQPNAIPNPWQTAPPNRPPQQGTTRKPQQPTMKPTGTSRRPQVTTKPPNGNGVWNNNNNYNNRPERTSVGSKSEAACQAFLKDAIPSIVPFIVNGREARLTEFPHMALLGYPYNNNPSYRGRTLDGRMVSWRCGGTLISERFVLTAAHCVAFLGQSEPFIVRLGELDWSSDDDGAVPVDVAIKNITLHPEYVTERAYHDIALVELAKPVEFTAAVQPACLPPRAGPQQQQAEAVALRTRKNLTVTGWGDTEFAMDQPSTRLLKAELSYVASSECNKTFTGAADKAKLPFGLGNIGHICARDFSSQNSSACLGDSGGPLQETIPSQILYRILGITSVGKLCASNIPTLFTRVADYVPWIESVVWK